ncbi:MAG: hypothetical protein HWQ38_37890 [Nostoc sp. NMS7]|uniref:hypothetical protein n=1 Tax=Nostoc sp. NMS7 TaxID=2815391 RepID=UPI0025DEB24D|nr:hypothetical protein [Nostoc sp. NMS7]MBN3951930.1 hypothetical protein [Nostoc sp. NMS7]
MRLVEVRYDQPEDKGLFFHPARTVFTNCWYYPETNEIQMVGGVGRFICDISGLCSKFLGYYEARVISEIDHSRWNEPDRYEFTESDLQE